MALAWSSTWELRNKTPSAVWKVPKFENAQKKRRNEKEDEETVDSLIDSLTTQTIYQNVPAMHFGIDEVPPHDVDLRFRSIVPTILANKGQPLEG
jgi:hypothetical protein